MMKEQTCMVVKIRFGHGPVVTRRKGKNGQAAVLLASASTLTAVCLTALGVWRLCEDLDLAGEFFFRDGMLAHWQVWIGAAGLTQYASWRLNRYAKSSPGAGLPEKTGEKGSGRFAPEELPADGRQPVARAAANV
jgi:hypothetical protein